ncbi:MAG: DUF2461 family protein [Ignavibacteriaceae bacterium]|nr:DUF2461 family protein [Ignavibacteriaceae bacterium]
MTNIPSFSGFSLDSFKFLGELERDKNNNTVWFSKNRKRYEENLVLPAKSFIVTIGQFFSHLNPAIRTEPKFNKTIMRINKDMRFAKGGPYRNYFLVHFGRFKMDSEFFVYFDKNGIEYGLFLNNTKGDGLYFNQNISSRGKDFIDCCERFKINNKFFMYELNKESGTVYPKFKAPKHFETISNMKYIILKKDITPGNKLYTSPDFLTEAIKTFSNLYPLYCFAISPNPMKLIDEFDERMGIAI